MPSCRIQPCPKWCILGYGLHRRPHSSLHSTSTTCKFACCISTFSGDLTSAFTAWPLSKACLNTCIPVSPAAPTMPTWDHMMTLAICKDITAWLFRFGESSPWYIIYDQNLICEKMEYSLVPISQIAGDKLTPLATLAALGVYALALQPLIDHIVLCHGHVFTQCHSWEI